jgi:hypothetical protein
VPPSPDAALRAAAERRFEEALARSSARDPREYYRERLKELRDSRPELYHQTLSYYEKTLVPTVADPDSDPVAEWLEYGRMMAALMAPGRTVQVDETGLAHDFDGASAAGALVLHLPTSSREPVLVVGLPAKLSGAQRATYELLVRRSPG